MPLAADATNALRIILIKNNYSYDKKVTGGTLVYMHIKDLFRHLVQGIDGSFGRSVIMTIVIDECDIFFKVPNFFFYVCLLSLY